MINEHPFPTLPLSWYFDPRVLEIEWRTIFSEGPAYVGCAAMVPNHGCFRTVPQRDHAEMLVRSGEQILLMSNICLHRNVLMLHGQGKMKALICPMHRWSYDLEGNVQNAPHYSNKPCLSLPHKTLQNWKGILFDGHCDVVQDLALLGSRSELDIHRYVFIQSEQEEQPINWKIPVEVFLDNYHVPVIHPGLTHFAHPSSWYNNDGAHDSPQLMHQDMRPNPDFLHNPASLAFEHWQQAILEITRGKIPSFAASIALYSPNIFLEWYPFTFVVTTYVPRTPELSLMTRDFFYDPQALNLVPEFPDLTKLAWDEIQQADDLAHASLQRGRALNYRQKPDGLSGYGAYQSTEDCIRLFHGELINSVLPYLL